MFAAPRRRLDRKPIIIALDQDNFYCGVERVLDASLVGKPVGITQKSLLATTSYEARARGVTKLMSIRKAKEMCPEMILVDGEDLTNYRRFSRGVVELVGAVVGVTEGGGRAVEKLGLDEVFVDVTNLVYDHLDQISTSWQSSESIFFPLPVTAQELTPDKTPPGFYYNPSSLPGHVLAPASRAIAPDPSSPDVDAQALLVAGHLAAFIRKKIKEIMGLTSSAGIARNKLLAKLVAGVKKPDAQTTFLAEPVRHGHEGEGGGEGDMVQKFLDSMEVRKLNGFGSKTVASLTDDLGARTIEFETPLTVRQTRSLFVRADFVRIFKDQPKLGPRLWGLLHGIDEEPVKPNPEYPRQISVEDSYARSMKRPLGKIREQMQALVVDLLDRLEDELMDDASSGGIWRPLEHAHGSKVKTAESSKRTWKRFPRQFRLALRLDWDHPGGRDSKSIVMPAFIFDTQRSVTDRAEALMSKIGVSLLKELLGLKKGDKTEDTDEFAVYVINVAAVNLTSEKPPPSLLDGWSSAPLPPDQEFLDSLPNEIKREVLGRYVKQSEPVKRKAEVSHEDIKKKRQKTPGPGHSATQAIEIDDEDEIIEIESSPETRPIDLTRLPTRHTALAMTRTTTPSLNDHDNYDNDALDEAVTTLGDEPSFGDDSPDVSSQTTCTMCGTTVFPFAREAHARWHDSDELETTL